MPFLVYPWQRQFRVSFVYPSCTLAATEAFVFNVHRPCTPVRVRYTTKGTRKIHVPLRVPLRVPRAGKGYTPEKPDFQRLPASCTVGLRFEEPTSPGEHIVHIDGVTGSSPVATTNPKKS